MIEKHLLGHGIPQNPSQQQGKCREVVNGEGMRLDSRRPHGWRDAAVQGHPREGTERFSSARLRGLAAHEAGKAAKAEEERGGLVLGRGERGWRERRGEEAAVLLRGVRRGRRRGRRRALAARRRR